MCGICGLFSKESGATSDSSFETAIGRMSAAMARRGPDDEGFWNDPEGRLRLGFRRLAILDLSAAGHQPMLSVDQRHVLVFNGEIYNYPELRREVESKGVRLRSTGDSEVLLEALAIWGLDLLPRLDGMFAFAWYEREQRRLTLARDHAGIKPLHFARFGDGLAFGSQYDQLLRTPWGTPGEPRLDVLRLFLQLNHIPPPYGLLENTAQLPPGHWLRIDARGGFEQRSWWRLPENPRPGLNAEEGIEALDEALDRSVQRQRLADVPVGVFLSGGVDSPLVAAYARQQTDRQLQAFTIGNPGWWQDEAPAAAELAKHLDVTHHVVQVGADETVAAAREVMAAQHEPFADFSLVPTLIISRFARQRVTVALSGDGGDELFFGYQRPVSLLRDGADFRWPHWLRWGLYGLGRAKLGRRRSDVIVFPSAGDYYLAVNSRFGSADLARLAPELGPLPADFDLYHSGPLHEDRELADFSRRAEFYGQLQRGLKKVDMASMHHGLEVRVPLLGREIIDLSLQIAPRDHLAGGRKQLLRRLLARHIPQGRQQQRKLGFSVPLAGLLRGPLRTTVEETLLDGPLYPTGLFRRQQVEAYWRQHLTSSADHKWSLWALLCLQWWARSKAAP